tara:strand:+ start:5499 stop:6290 length:792 start_codon:yes stop_codon:yes gene_type:complete
MSAPSPPTSLPSHTFPTAAAFAAFLEREHTSAPGIYLQLAKKASGIPSITGAEAVEVALCYGWIDGRANSIDDKWWTVRYTPRREKSIWSQKNVGTVARLIEEGRMRPAGLAAVEAAKADGRWDRAYAGPANMVAPEDFAAALTAEPAAQTHFEELNKSEKYAVLIQLAIVSVKNRSKKINALVQTLAIGKRPDSPKKSRKPVKARAVGSKRDPKVNRAAKKARSSSQAKKSDIVAGQEGAQGPVARHDQPSRPNRDGLRPRT